MVPRPATRSSRGGSENRRAAGAERLTSRGVGRLRVEIGVLLGAVALVFVPASFAASPSLYHGPAPRPGPDILYRPPAQAPQLQKRRRLARDPILVSGASAYRDGEFLYQDFLYDDHGARGLSRDPGDPRDRRRQLLGAERHLHVPDGSGLRQQRRRPGRAPRQAAGRPRPRSASRSTR